jgi:exodeoxyribonuclease III
VRVVTWNVNGIRARFGEVVSLCRSEQPDVLCLQELKASPGQIPEPLTGLPEYINVWHGGPGGYSGVSVHVRRAWTSAAAATAAGTPSPAFAPPSFDVQYRAIEVALGSGVRALSLYVPNGNRDLPGKLGFLEALRGHVREARQAGVALLVCGDLNVACSPIDVHETLRDAEAVGQLDEERALLQALFDEGLVDLGRAFDPDNHGLFTWWPPWREERRKNHGWRLDYILASESLARTATGCRVLADFGTSDHAPVAAEIDLDTPGQE